MSDGLLGIFIGAAVTLFVGGLTRRHEIQKLELERKDKYKLAAIEKRLEAHQKALVEWDILAQNIFSTSDIKIPLIHNAHNYWFKYCLYLEKNTRREFKEVNSIISDYTTILEINKQMANREAKDKHWKVIEKNWERIWNFPNIVFKDVALEPMSFEKETDAEGKKLKEI